MYKTQSRLVLEKLALNSRLVNHGSAHEIDMMVKPDDINITVVEA